MATNNSINFPFYGFSATLVAPLLNVTGDATMVTNNVDTVIYQTPDNNFDVLTGVYSCPKTGFYAVSGFLDMNTFIGGATQGTVFIQNSGTSNKFRSSQPVANALGGTLLFNVGGILYCLAGSTIYMYSESEMGAKTVCIGQDTSFSAHYLGS